MAAPNIIAANIVNGKTTAANLTSNTVVSWVQSAMGANQSKIIADVIDIFIMYGLKVTRELVIKLLNKTCYINNIEKYNIKIDEEILLISSNYSYYPYK